MRDVAVVSYAADALAFVGFCFAIALIAIGASGLFAVMMCRALGLQYRRRLTSVRSDNLEIEACEICCRPSMFTRQPRRDQPGKPIRLCSNHMIEDGELDRLASPRQ